jgi:hypothetical protein
VIALLLIWSATTNASVVWDWSFNGESGQFITDGTDHSAGTYNVADFVVLSSSSGASIGSWSGGQYDDTEFSNGSPYWFVWDGAQVTELISSQSNWDSWFTFDDLGSNITYLFGWETGNINTLTHASAYDITVSCCSQASYVYSVTPSQVPVPAAVWLFGSALAGLGWLRRKQTV